MTFFVFTDVRYLGLKHRRHLTLIIQIFGSVRSAMIFITWFLIGEVGIGCWGLSWVPPVMIYWLSLVHHSRYATECLCVLIRYLTKLNVEIQVHTSQYFKQGIRDEISPFFFLQSIVFAMTSGQMWNHIRGPPYAHRNPQTGQVVSWQKQKNKILWCSLAIATAFNVD